MAAPNKHPWWIKERYNPQLGTYYVGMGRMSKTAARRAENPLYGSNIMHCFDSQDAYDVRLRDLREAGERVQ